MPHHKSAAKRLKQSKKLNEYNKHYRTLMKTAVKKVESSITKEDAEKNYLMAQSVIDKLVKKGILKKNNASNKKSKLMRFIRNMEK